MTTGLRGAGAAAGSTLIASLLLLANPGAAAAGEGFSTFTFGKSTVTLERVLAPKVFLPGVRMSVKVTSQDPKDAAAAQRLQSQLESDLPRNDSRLIDDPVHPQTLIEVSLLQNQYHEEWQVQQKSATASFVDALAGKNKSNSPSTQRVKVVSQIFVATYKVTDARSKRVLASNTFNADAKAAFPDGLNAPDAASVENAAIQRVVDRVAGDITTTRERIEILVPKGTLADAARFAEAGLWSKYLEAVSAIPEKAAAADESYRKYALGLAHEALGYTAEDVDTTLKYLEQASAYYNQALEANPKEKYFSQVYTSHMPGKRERVDPPLERANSALTGYRKLKDLQDGVARAAAAPDAAAGSKGLGAGGGAARTMDNAAVIKMTAAGLGDDIILAAIKSTPAAEFDTSPDGLIALSEGNVSKRVIQRIQEHAGQAKPEAKSAKKARPKTHPPTGG
jgi:tetratricopeptide (TPR) repeat protein